ncbi:hypothetical protein EJB05_15520 [Eragrostis curvula]|uniref:Uncharacterized protein n=1 Tax=Eragrostis curvula TaxID=38414 RepID=A0A5J9W1D1_9POAL|nr:hypothetical protein EJB05_15520 [Eragrostis curvula]
MRGVLGGSAAAAPLLCISAPSRCPSSALSCSCPGAAAVAIVKGADRGSIHGLRIFLTAFLLYIQNMSVRPEASSPNPCRKRRHPMSICSETRSANDGVSSADHSNYLDDCPTDFDFESNRPLRRRLCPDLSQPHGAGNTHRPRTKCKVGTSSCRLDMFSCQTSDRGVDPTLANDPSTTSDVTLNGAPNSSNDFPTDFNFESTHRIRRRLHSHTSDLGQPDSASSPRLRVKHKSSTSLSEPSCSRINEVDEDEQQRSNVQVSSSGHRQRLYLMNTLGYVMPR